MRILMINVVCGIRSTGRICTDIATVLEKQGHEVKIAYGRENVPEQYERFAVRIGTDSDVKLHALKARLQDGSGFGSKKATVKFVEWVKEYNPDVIHLHNIHGYYINLAVLFEYLRTCGKRIIWTLHDCWAFTGHAAFCEYANCDKWKKGCGNCPKRDDYPVSLTDHSAQNWNKKRSLLTGVPQMTIVTPSHWLESLVKESFLSEYSTKVIPNGIDASVFKPTESDIKTRLGIEDRKMILGVAALWEKRKGLEDFIELSKRLDKEFRIVLVGISKEQMKLIPDNIICLEKTNSPTELVELYSAADVFLNPTYEDNYPTVNLEAIACGTPVITYDTGGSPESAEIFGCILPKKDLDGVINTLNAMNFEKKEVDIFKEYMVNQYVELIQTNGESPVHEIG